MAKLPVAPVAKILKEAGAERVSEKAAKALVEALEEIAMEIAKGAVELAKHANRKTVKEEDVRMALKMIVNKGE